MMKRIFFLVFCGSILVSCDNRSGSSSSGGDYNPSFTGSGDSESGTYVIGVVSTVYYDGAPAGKYEVIQRGSSQYVRRVGGTQEYSFFEDHQYGYNYTFWNGATWLFFF